MKRGIFLPVLFVALIITTSFSNGQTEKETRNVTGFTKVGFGVSGNLSINFGPEFKVVLEGDKASLEEIITEVSGDKLVIRKERDSWRNNMHEKVSVYITMPELKGLSVSGSGKAEVKDVLKTSELSLNVSGSGKIYTTDIIVSNLECGISGSGDINIGGNGKASSADISISGSGNCSCETLKSGTAKIHISGSGNCYCNVTDALQASVSGSGNVTYIGNPKVDVRVSGSGHVRSK